MRQLMLIGSICLFSSLCQSLNLRDWSRRVPAVFDRETRDRHDVLQPRGLDVRDPWDKWSSSSTQSCLTTVPACATVTVTVTSAAISTVTAGGTATATVTVTEKGVTDKGNTATVTVSGQPLKELTTVLLISTITVATTTVSTTVTTGTVTITTPGPGEKASTTITSFRYDATHITLVQIANTANSTYNYSNSSTSNQNSLEISKTEKSQAYADAIFAYRMTTPWWAILLIVLLMLFGLLILAALALLLLGKKHHSPPACPAIPPGTCSSCGEPCSSCVCEKIGPPTPPVCAMVPVPCRRSSVERPASLALFTCPTCGQRHERGCLCGQLGLSRPHTGAEIQEARECGHGNEVRCSGESQYSRGGAEACVIRNSSESNRMCEVEQTCETEQACETSQAYGSLQSHSHAVGLLTFEGANKHSETKQTSHNDWFGKSGQSSVTRKVHESTHADEFGGSWLSRDEVVETNEHAFGEARLYEGGSIGRGAHQVSSVGTFGYNTTSTIDQEQESVQLHKVIGIHNGIGQVPNGAMLSQKEQSSTTEVTYGGAKFHSAASQVSSSTMSSQNEKSSSTERGYERVRIHESDSFRNVVDQTSSSAMFSQNEKLSTTEVAYEDGRAYGAANFLAVAGQTRGSEMSSYGEMMLAAAQAHGSMQEHVNGDRYVVGKETFERRSFMGGIVPTSLHTETTHGQLSESYSSKKFGTHVSVAEISDDELDDSDSGHVVSQEIMKSESSGNVLRSRLHLRD